MQKPIPAFILCSFFLAPCSSAAQQADTVKRLEEVRVTGYPGNQLLLRSTGAVNVIGGRQLQRQPGLSMVPALAAAPGVRMEERSPGSYRLSVRGSLLRSPFGVRNLKVYLDDLPLTDAGGNTYLNAVGMQSLKGMEILKGPDGSLFGANSGGVLILRSGLDDSVQFNAGISAGSYGMLAPYASYRQPAGRHDLYVHQSYQSGEGYRNHSAMHRWYTRLADTWSYSDRNQLSVSAFYSGMHYQTPGGLTLAQYLANPRLARQPTPALPGAEQQHAGIYSDMLFGGLTHTMQLGGRVRHTVSIFGSVVDFRNPFITNYETRKERSMGLRTYFSFDGDAARKLVMSYQLGAEWQQTRALISNYANLGGSRGTLQAANTIHSGQFFLFGRASADLNRVLALEASLSLNDNRYLFRDASGIRIVFDPQLMPRLAMSWKAAPGAAFRAVVSRGYSVPTTAEVRPSTNLVYEGLQPENGWNYEAGFRAEALDNRLSADLAAFYYRLNNAIVRQIDAGGAEYFTNAGGTRQKGLETAFTFKIIRPGDAPVFPDELEISNSYTLSNFRFSSYRTAGQDHSGRRLTGVPRNMNTSQLYLADGPAYLFAQYIYTGRLPLNDSNSAYASGSHLVQLKTGYRINVSGRSGLELFGGVDNLLNKRYSLGHDINAAGNRFYNAAPARNYFFGLSWRTSKN